MTQADCTSDKYDVVDRVSFFKKQLKMIEKDHRLWFRSRRGVYIFQLHDTITNHYYLDWRKHYNPCFGFLQDSDLPENIRQACRNAFQNIFE